MRSSVNVFGPTELQSEPQQATHLFLWYTGVRQSYHLEIQMPLLWVTLVTKMTKEDKDQLCLQELEALDEKRLQVQQRIELYKLESRKPSIRKLKRGYSRKET